MKKAIKGAIRYDSGKPMMHLMSPIALEEIAKVLTAGAKKYPGQNWRKGMAWSRVIDSAMRHLNKFNAGIDLDEDTNLSHLAHCACNIMFLLEYEKTHQKLDDRYKVVAENGEKAERTKRIRASSGRKSNAKVREQASKKRNR